MQTRRQNTRLQTDKAESIPEGTTEGTENTEGKEGGGPRDEADSVSGEGRIAGRAGAGQAIPGRKRPMARGAVGGSEKGCNG